jgi:hypothetical protein
MVEKNDYVTCLKVWKFNPLCIKNYYKLIIFKNNLLINLLADTYLKVAFSNLYKPLHHTPEKTAELKLFRSAFD